MDVDPAAILAPLRRPRGSGSEAELAEQADEGEAEGEGGATDDDAADLTGQYDDADDEVR